MSRKCLNREVHQERIYSHHYHDDDGSDILSFETHHVKYDSLQLGEMILHSQDGDIKQDDFDELQNCLLTDPEALEYYVDFMRLSAELYAMFNEQKMSSMIASLRAIRPQTDA